MSFILDALRKSEHERQRTALPGIAQVPFGLPRRELPRWAIVLIAVLAVTVLALGAAWWRSTKSDSTARVEPAAAARAEFPLALPPAAIATPPSPVYSAPAAAPQTTDRPTVADDAAPPPVSAPRRAAAAAGVANEPVNAAAAAPEEPVSDEPTLPSPAALAAEGVNMPELRLELHAYSPRPAERFVFINGSKYVEGARLAEGPQLLRIAPNGAVLVYLGHRFLLAPQ